MPSTDAEQGINLWRRTYVTLSRLLRLSGVCVLSVG